MQKVWSQLNTAEKEPYFEAANEMLFPDLRPGYRDNDELRRVLARNIFYMEIDHGIKPGETYC